MVRTRFDEELNKMHVDLDRMCHYVVSAIDNCILAFKEHNLELAKDIVLADKQINDIERSIEAKCLSLILKQQPVASDLRDVSTALKVVTDLERIGDQSADIAELIIELPADNDYYTISHIPNMAMLASKMVNKSLEAFHLHDLSLAKEIKAMDKEMDELFEKVKDDIIQIIKESNEHSDLSIQFLMIAKYFERIGDHVVNICEWIEFNQTGKLNDQRLI